MGGSGPLKPSELGRGRLGGLLGLHAIEAGEELVEARVHVHNVLANCAELHLNLRLRVDAGLLDQSCNLRLDRAGDLFSSSLSRVHNARAASLLGFPGGPYISVTARAPRCCSCARRG